MCGECKELGHTRKRCPQIECRICKEKGHLSYVCDKRVNQESENHEDQRVESVPLPPTEMAIDDDTINEKGPTDNERKNMKAESNETVKDTIETSEVMVAERVVQGCKRHISDSDSDGKIQHRRARIHPVPNLGAGKRRDKTVSTSAVEKVSTDKLT